MPRVRRCHLKWGGVVCRIGRTPWHCALSLLRPCGRWWLAANSNFLLLGGPFCPPSPEAHWNQLSSWNDRSGASAGLCLLGALREEKCPAWYPGLSSRCKPWWLTSETGWAIAKRWSGRGSVTHGRGATGTARELRWKRGIIGTRLFTSPEAYRDNLREDEERGRGRPMGEWVTICGESHRLQCSWAT